MTIVRYNPIKNMARWNNEFGNMCESFFEGRNLTTRNDALAPRVDIVDEKEKVTMEMEIPGMDKDNIKVTVENGILTINGELSRENVNVVRCERHYGAFSRSFTLGDEIDSENIKADYRNGILYLTLPKTEKSLPKEISVEIN